MINLVVHPLGGPEPLSEVADVGLEILDVFDPTSVALIPAVLLATPHANLPLHVRIFVKDHEVVWLTASAS